MTQFDRASYLGMFPNDHRLLILLPAPAVGPPEKLDLISNRLFPKN